MMTMEGVSEKTGLLLLITTTTALATAFSMPEFAPLIYLGFFGRVYSPSVLIRDFSNKRFLSRYSVPVAISMVFSFLRVKLVFLN